MRTPLTFLAVLVVAGCGTSVPRGSATYTFAPQQSSVRVDSPQLRAEKAAANIEGCPESTAGSAGGSAAGPGGMPTVTLPCLGGGRDVDLAGLRGPAVVNFWAQWCGPCRTEAPLMQELHQAARGAVMVLGVDYQDPRPSYAIGFAKQLGLTYPQIADPTGLTRSQLHIPGLPMTVFVGATGKIVYTEYGPVESAAQLAELVKTHLGVRVDLRDSP